MKKIVLLILMAVTLAGYSQKATNYWDGSYNYYWHNANNWSLGHIPTSTEDVIIPNGMTRYPSVDSSDETINSLTIHSAAYVKIGAYELNVNTDIEVYGEIDMDHTDAVLRCDNITWRSGSQAQTTGDCDIYCYGIWEFAVGADVQLDNGYAAFYGSASQYIRSKDADCYFNNVWVNKAGGEFAISSQSSATCKIKGNLSLYGSNYEFASYSPHTIQIGGNLVNGNATIEIVLDYGAIEFTGNTFNHYCRPQPGDYVNNLIINTGSYQLDMSTSYTTAFEIKGDVIINSGALDVNSMDLIVGGDWDNNVGPQGFLERDEKVTFNGSSGHQYCSDETFHTLEINKSAGAFRVNGADVVCAEYDWTDGAVDVLSGSFTANDLLDAGIAGAWYVNDVVHLHQTDGYVDLLGDVHIFDGGYMHVYGGNDDSYWPYGSAGSSIELENDGALKFHDVGINIRSSGTLTSNITGGWIGMIGDFRVDRAGFTAPSAIWAMLGTTDTDVQITNGSINQMDIDKLNTKTDGLKPLEITNKEIKSDPVNSIKFISGKYSQNQEISTGSIYTRGFTGREGKVYTPSKSNTVSASGNIILGHLAIYGGTFDLNGKTVDMWGDMGVLNGGILKMANPADILNVRSIYWYSGSSDQITTGNINVSLHWDFKNGTNAQLGTGNTVHFTGTDTQFVYCKDADAEYGSVIIENTLSSVWLHSTSTYDMHVAGNMTVNNGAKFYIQHRDLLVEGTLDIKSGGLMDLYSGGLLTNNSNFSLFGDLDVGEGDVVVHGTFDLMSTGELTINGGSFSYDDGSYYCDIYGTFNLSDGIFIADELIRIQSTADVNVSGGTIGCLSGIIADIANTFQPTGGVFECQTDNNSFGMLRMHATNYFHDLKINPATGIGGGFTNSDLHITNDLIISAGHLIIYEHTVIVDNDVIIYGGLDIGVPEGELVVGDDITWKSGSNATWVTDGEIHVNHDWTFENGTDAQLGPGNIVRFIGSGSTSIYNYDAEASFGSMSAYKSAGTNTYLNGLSTYPIHCTGSLSVESSNNLHIQHEALVVDQGVFIGFNSLLDMLSNGSLEDGNDLDLYGTLNVGGGEATVNGDFTLYSTGTLTITDGSFICNDPYDGFNKRIEGNLNLTGVGLFEITNNTVQIFSTANCNITNGIFRVGANFFATQAGTFQPSGGVFDMSAGYSGGMIYCNNGNYFYNIEINDNASAETDITVIYNLGIIAGTFNVTDQTVEIGHNVNIYSTLQMTQSTGVLKSGYQIYWKPGSFDDITAGNIYSNYWTWEDGTNAQLGIGNTAHINSGISNFDPDTEFGNLIIGEWSKSGSSFEGDLKFQAGKDNFCTDGCINKGHSNGSTKEGQMDGKTYYPRWVAGNCTYLPSESWYTSVDIIVQGTLDIQDGASQTLTGTNTIYTYSDFTLNGTLDLSTEGNGYVDGDFEIASTGELIIEGGEFIVENSSDSYTDIYGSFIVSDGLFQVRNTLVMKSSAITNVSGGMLRANGFRADTPGVFEPSGGVVEIQTLTMAIYGGIDCRNGNYLYNLNINRVGSTGGAQLQANLLITHDFNILLGTFVFGGYSATVHGNTTIFDGKFWMDNTAAVLNAGNDPSDEIIWKSDASFYNNNKGRINIYGDCTIENGVSSYIKAAQTFAFVGTGDQNLYNYDDATFGIIELDKPSGELIIPTGSEVECASYNWESGTLTVDGGSFIAQDLVDPGIYGTNNLYSGLIDFTQDELQTMSLQGEVNVTGGTFNIRGGDAECSWASNDDLILNMTNGTIDFIDNGLHITGSNTLTMNVTGGVIRTHGSFYNYNSGFQCDGGTVEMQAYSVLVALELECEPGYIHNLLINRGAGNIFLKSDITIMGDLIVESGYFITHGVDITCMGNVEIVYFGTLQIWDGTSIKLDNMSSFIVKDNGSFATYGEPGNMNLVTRESPGDYYYFIIEEHGHINPMQTIFEYMADDGVNLHEDSYLSVQRFNNCIFRNGKEGGTLLTINSNQTCTVDGAVFESTGKGSAYNVAKTNDDDRITFTNFSGNFAGPAYENDPFNRLDWFVPELSVLPSVRNVGADAGVTTFDVTSNVDWTVTESVSWFTVDPIIGSNDGTLTVDYEENLSLTPRSGTITISGDDVADVVVTVNQAGADPYLSITPLNYDVSAAAGEVTYEITSNTTWTIIEGTPWIVIDPMGGTGDGVITLIYDKNTSALYRISSHTISAPGVADIHFTLSQDGADPVLAVDPANQDISAEAGSTTFNITSNTGWTVTESEGWLSIAPASGSGNSVINVFYDENASALERIGEITVTATGGSPEIMVTVTQATYSLHSISVPAGWSGLSSYLLPIDDDIENIFNPIDGELIIAMTMDEMYYPFYNINTIGTWNAQSVYKVKLDATADLTIIGVPEENKTVALADGWDMIPVISECVVDVEELFAPVVADLEIVKDVAGYGIYWPVMGINTLGTLNPGKAYYVLASNSISVTFGDCAKATFENLQGFGNLGGLSPWELSNPTPSSHTIAIMPEAIKGFEAGIIIGAFDLNGNCFGIIPLDGKATCLTIFGDDNISANKDGFAVAEQIFFKLYKPSTKEEFELIPEFDFTMSSVDGNFAENGISAIKGFKAGSLGNTEFGWGNTGIYPNPSSGVFNVTGLHGIAKVKVTDIHGQEVYSNQVLTVEENQVDLGHCQPGIYMVSIKQNKATTFHKLILK